MRVLKGHGTENDFVIIPDLNNDLNLSAEFVSALCDRRTGVGADGVLRVVRTATIPEVAGLADGAEFFMDYRNADGSVAEMCGNGVRVFAIYLRKMGLIFDSARIATRGGTRLVTIAESGAVTVQMGRPDFDSRSFLVHQSSGVELAALAHISLPNPHVVVQVADLEQLKSLDLTDKPIVTPALPHGQNVEFIAVVADRRISMRVYERGVGETRSCGTGICAAVAALATLQKKVADELPWEVEVPGGSCEVIWRADGEMLLRGPAVIVAEIQLEPQWCKIIV